MPTKKGGVNLNAFERGFLL